MPDNTGVVRGVLGISVTALQIDALVGKVIAAGMAEHVGPDSAELRLLAGTRTM